MPRLPSLIPLRFRSQLDAPNLRALQLLEETVSQSRNVRHVGAGQLRAQRGHAEVILDVGLTISLRDADNPHLSITVAVPDFDEPPSRICVRAAYGIPVADSIVTFVLLVDAGWPRGFVPDTLESAIERANHRYFRDFHRLQAEQAARHHREERARLRLALRDITATAFADECAANLVAVAGDVHEPNAAAVLFWEQAYAAALEVGGSHLTSNLLHRAVRAATWMIQGGADGATVDGAIAPFLAKFSIFSINAAIRELNSDGPEVEILKRFRRGAV